MAKGRLKGFGGKVPQNSGGKKRSSTARQSAKGSLGTKAGYGIHPQKTNNKSAVTGTISGKGPRMGGRVY